MFISFIVTPCKRSNYRDVSSAANLNWQTLTIVDLRRIHASFLTLAVLHCFDIKMTEHNPITIFYF